MALKLRCQLQFPVASIKILFFFLSNPKYLNLYKCCLSITCYHSKIHTKTATSLITVKSTLKLSEAYEKQWLTRLNGFFQDDAADFYLITGEKIQLVQQLFCL